MVFIGATLGPIGSKIMRMVFIIVGLSGCATPLSKLGLDTGYEGTAGGFLDGGDGPSSSMPGDDCSGGGVLDCTLDCWVSDARAYIGDGNCDTGQRGPDFSCELLDYDGGDCADVDGGPDSSDEGGGEESDGGSTDGAGGGGAETGGVSGGGSLGGSAEGTTEAGGDDGAVSGGGSGSGTTTSGSGTGSGTTTSGGGTDGGTTTGGGTDEGTTTGGTGEIPDTDDGDYVVGSDCTTDIEWPLYAEADLFGGYTIHSVDPGAVGYRDCAGTCVPEEHYLDWFYAWWGDGYCDDGVDSPADFSCSELDWDLGDCPITDSGSSDSGSETGGSDESGLAGSPCMAETPEGMVEGTTDCSGDCIGVSMAVMEYWVGDGSCDDGTGSGSSTYVNLLCEAFSYDGDDCF